MALVPVVTKTAIADDCSNITVTDGTGNYHVTTNPTGYGAPNATRSSLYLKLFVTLKKTDGDVVLTIPAYNENTASSWTVTITEDGYYEVYSFFCKEYDELITYSEGHIVYNPDDDTFYISVVDSNLGQSLDDEDFWVECENAADQFKAAIELAQPNTYSDVDEFVSLCNGMICRSKAAALAYSERPSASCKCKDKFREIDWMIKTAKINEADEAYTKAQVIVENMNDLCTCIDND